MGTLLMSADHGVDSAVLYTDSEYQHASLSAHNVVESSVGRWHNLDKDTRVRTITARSANGTVTEFDMFQNR